MAAFEARKGDLEALGAKIVAGVAQREEHARKMAGRDISLPIAYGLTQEEAESFGAWWEHERGYVQPSEFILAPDGTVLAAMYASGPLGRMSADEVATFLTNRERRRLEGEAASAG